MIARMNSLAISLQTNTPLVNDTVAFWEHKARLSFEARPPFMPHDAANMLCIMPVRFKCWTGPVTITGLQLWDQVPPGAPGGIDSERNDEIQGLEQER